MRHERLCRALLAVRVSHCTALANGGENPWAFWPAAQVSYGVRALEVGEHWFRLIEEQGGGINNARFGA